MQSLEELKAYVEGAVEGARLEILPNGSASGQRSLLIERKQALAICRVLQDDPRLRYDYLSNLAAVDWPEAVTKETVKAMELVDGKERLIERTTETRRPGFFEVVYHLYSLVLKRGPLVLRMRTPNRDTDTRLPSLTPLWRGAEFQEREAYDLYGIVFEGHPDLRRIFMWEGFVGYPMRKDYVEPDDYEYEPTPHDQVAERSKAHK